MKKVAFYTLGCKLNFAESSYISKIFKDKGFEQVDFYDKPDIYVINTCSVTDNADKKCRKLVQSALKVSPYAFIIVMGCYAQLKPYEISSIKGVDLVVGAKDKFKILDIVDSFEKCNSASIQVSNINEVNDFEHAYSSDDRTRTFLKVQDGCNYHCSFCTIPLARGNSRSDTIENVLGKAKEAVSQGAKEIIITGVNIGDYGIVEGKKEADFLSLITKLDEIEGIDRFRISSIEPNLLTNDIIKFVANSSKFVPHFHIPLQSGNDKILKMMRRRYTRDLYQDRVSMIKQLMPDSCIGVDVIVGFPGETEEMFLDTYEFINALDVSYLHVFPYSERPNTKAITLGDVVPHQERFKRSKMLRILSDKKKRKFYQHNVGKHGLVLFEQGEENEFMYGFTKNYIKVRTAYNSEMINTVHKVMLKNINDEGIFDISMV
jgi:threonylcarbamoyladenosine tRNA methylthiotransferase MtaB